LVLIRRRVRDCAPQLVVSDVKVVIGRRVLLVTFDGLLLRNDRFFIGGLKLLFRSLLLRFWRAKLLNWSIGNGWLILQMCIGLNLVGLKTTSVKEGRAYSFAVRVFVTLLLFLESEKSEDLIWADVLKELVYISEDIPSSQTGCVCAVYCECKAWCCLKADRSLKWKGLRKKLCYRFFAGVKKLGFAESFYHHYL
jgi:hypothetical protein